MCVFDSEVAEVDVFSEGQASRVRPGDLEPGALATTYHVSGPLVSCPVDRPTRELFRERTSVPGGHLRVDPVLTVTEERADEIGYRDGSHRLVVVHFCEEDHRRCSDALNNKPIELIQRASCDLQQRNNPLETLVLIGGRMGRKRAH
jgi:hypothetical protein